MVTFLLLEGIVPGKRNCLQVIDEIHEIRSPSSVSGLRFSLTTRFPAGNFLQELKSGGMAAVAAAPVVAAPPPLAAAVFDLAGSRRWRGATGVGAAWAAAPGSTLVTLRSIPSATAARSGAGVSANAAKTVSNRVSHGGLCPTRVIRGAFKGLSEGPLFNERLVIGCCSPR